MQKNRKILYSAQTFKFCENAKRQRAKKEPRRKKDNKIFEMELVRQCDHNICMNNWCFNILKKKLQWKFSKDSYQTVFL